MRGGPTALGLAHRMESEEPSKPMPPGFPRSARHKRSLCLLFAVGGSEKLKASEFFPPALPTECAAPAGPCTSRGGCGGECPPSFKLADKRAPSSRTLRRVLMGGRTFTTLSTKACVGNSGTPPAERWSPFSRTANTCHSEPCKDNKTYREQSDPTGPKRDGRDEKDRHCERHDLL